MVVLVLMVNTYDSGGRWRELRAREVTELSAARHGSVERTLPGERRSGQLRDVSSAAGPLGVVWVVTSYPLVAAGLEKTLEGKADVRIGGDAPPRGVFFILPYVDGTGRGIF